MYTTEVIQRKRTTAQREHTVVSHKLPYTMKVLRQKSFAVFVIFACPWNCLYENLKLSYSNMDLRESMYVGFHESFSAKVCVYDLLWNFSALKLSWYTVTHCILYPNIRLALCCKTGYECGLYYEEMKKHKDRMERYQQNYCMC